MIKHKKLMRSAEQRKLNTRAQVEMMGLVIIVILVTIGFFFAVSMGNRGATKKTTLDVFNDEQLSSGFLITLLETQVKECTTLNSVVTIRDLAVDCVRESDNKPQKYSCGGLDSCFVLHNITEHITNETLLQSNNFELLFNFKAQAQEEKALLNITEGGGCPGIRTAPALQPIPLFRVVNGNSYFLLSIC